MRKFFYAVFLMAGMSFATVNLSAQDTKAKACCNKAVTADTKAKGDCPLAAKKDCPLKAGTVAEQKACCAKAIAENKKPCCAKAPAVAEAKK